MTGMDSAGQTCGTGPLQRLNFGDDDDDDGTGPLQRLNWSSSVLLQPKNDDSRDQW